MKLHHAVLLASLALAPPASGDVTLFLGTPSGSGSVEVHDELGVLAVRRPPELQGIVLLPVDFVGRSALSQLDPTRPRWRSDVAGAARLQLPGGVGSLYRYRRDGLPGTPSAFGFFLVDANGSATALFERDGTGPLGTVDPFAPKLAVDGTASALLVATTLAAGGDLLEVELATGAVTDRTASQPPQAFALNGLVLADSFGAGVSGAGVLRFARAVGQGATFVTFPAPAPTFFQGDVAWSGDGSCVATLAGTGAGALDVYCFDNLSDAVRVSTVPRALTGAGYLPEVPDGPHLALSTDGSLCMWSSEETLTRETWVRPVVATPAEQQVTADASFVDTLDTSGGILPYRADAFLMLVGESDDTVGMIEGADLYRVQVTGASGVPTITNLSMTSGDSVPPFEGGGRVETEEGYWSLPGGGQFLLLADAGQGGGTADLLLVDGVTGVTQLLLSAVRTVPLLEIVGTRLALGVTRRQATDSTELYSGPADLSSALTLVEQAGLELELDRFATHPAGLLAFAASTVTEEYVLRVDLNTNAANLFATFPLPFGPALGFTSAGDVALTLGIPGVAMAHGVWPIVGAPRLLPAGLRTGQVLPR